LQQSFKLHPNLDLPYKVTSNPQTNPPELLSFPKSQKSPQKFPKEIQLKKYLLITLTPIHNPLINSI